MQYSDYAFLYQLNDSKLVRMFNVEVENVWPVTSKSRCLSSVNVDITSLYSVYTPCYTWMI